MKGYKVFNPDWTCRDFQYEVGKTYKHEGEIGLCKTGFHFCKDLLGCFRYYSFYPTNKVAEVEATGEVIVDEHKCVTNKITIVKELSWQEVLDLVNTGYGNTGHGNTGNYNTGNYNTGNYNTGNRNTGDYNSGDGNSGYFNTINQPLYIFNKPVNMNRYDFYALPGIIVINSKLREKLNKRISEIDMTNEEKEAHPDYKITGGYLKRVEYKEAWSSMWRELTGEEKEEIKNIPNFDPIVFEEITGIDVNEQEEK